MRSPATICYRGLRFGDAVPLTAHQHDALIDVFHAPHDPAEGVLGGRRAVKRLDLAGIGPVVVKQFARGGAIRFFNRQTHIRWGPPRCAREMAWLQRARQLRIHAPDPVAWADSGGGLFYRCWLVTRTIPETLSLAQLGLQNSERTAAVFPGVHRQLEILIENRIHHKDLHPGNILIDNRHDAFFIDFDKATRHRGDRQSLAAKYLRRWRRAVAKYGLPPEMNRLMAEALSRRWRL